MKNTKQSNPRRQNGLFRGALMKLGVFSNYTLAAGVFLTACAGLSADNKAWVVDSQTDWTEYVDQKENLEFKKGFAEPTDKTSTFRSKLKSFPERVSAKSIRFDQSPVWDNWEKVENLGPINMGDAPVFVTVGPNNYWAFGRYGDAGKARSFKAETARLEGFDVPLLTTPFKNQYNAPGGLKPGLGGYHAWQSRDMVNWVHHGPVSEEFSRWVTTAEYADGKLYLYYDFPNDMDPFLYIDDNLFDGKPGKNMGLAFPDPSIGSDCTFIRDEKGHFHVIYEDWSPVKARDHAYDSPLAGHAVSKDGIKDFKILKPAVDQRTTPTGPTKTWRLHANQHPKGKSYRNSPHPARFPDDHYKETRYQVHSPKQDAYGDWAAIRIGTQYYLFGDYHSANAKAKNLSVARFTSSSLDEEFTYCGKFGEGHPDPDVGFAEGRFYLFTQQTADFTSPGPWVERVDARVGVDTDNDGKIDIWTDWKRVKESYDYVEGFAKHVKRSPAALDVSGLPAGYGFQFEFKMTDTTANMSKPIMDTVTLTFTEAP